MKLYTVTTEVLVEVDESQFTPTFLREFSEDINPGIRTIENHREYLAELYATGRITGYPSEFVEGYGELQSMGIKFSLESCTVD